MTPENDFNSVERNNSRKLSLNDDINFDFLQTARTTPANFDQTTNQNGEAESAWLPELSFTGDSSKPAKATIEPDPTCLESIVDDRIEKDSDLFSAIGSSSDMQTLYGSTTYSALERKTESHSRTQMAMEVPQREYTVRPGDTHASIAKRELGKGASPEAIKLYTKLLEATSGTDNPRPGEQIILPAVHKDGTFSLVNPDDPNESYKYLGNGNSRAENSQSKQGYTEKINPDGTTITDAWGPANSDNYKLTVYPNGSERTDFKDGTGFTREPGGEEKHWGPKPEDNWTLGRNGERIEKKPDGTEVTIWSDGSELHKYKDGRGYSKSADGYVKAWGPKTEDNYIVSPDGTKFWKDRLGVSHSERSDGRFGISNHRFSLDGKLGGEIYFSDNKGGSYQLRRELAIVKTNKDGSVTRYEKNLDQTTTWPDGTIQQRNPLTGAGFSQKPDGQGGYVKHHWGRSPEQNYDEKYDGKTGITTTVDGRGDKTTKWPNNVVKVERHDHSGYVRQPDGSEHHWGPHEKDNRHSTRDDSVVSKSRQELDKIAEREIPEKDRALFKENLNKFEERAKREHLPPEEVAKTYEQLSKLLSAKDAKVSKADRVLLAENFAHHLNHDESVDQGQHNTCNVTTIAERGFSRQPSRLAEMVTTTAIEGKWTAKDGKVIILDAGSLLPRAEERNSPPKDGDRSYAVQLLNLVMVNDATQRRLPPAYYRQGNPDPARPGDTGERLVGADGKPVLEKECYDDYSTVPPTKKYRDVVVSEPTLSDSEIYLVGKRLYGTTDFYLIAGNRADGNGVVKYETQQQLHEKLIEMKNQHRLPAVIAVNGATTPIGTAQPGTASGPHVVSVRDYDEKTGRVRISNQWGSKNDQWVDIKDLYENSKT